MNVIFSKSEETKVEIDKNSESKTEQKEEDKQTTEQTKKIDKQTEKIARQTEEIDEATKSASIDKTKKKANKKKK